MACWLLGCVDVLAAREQPSTTYFIIPVPVATVESICVKTGSLLTPAPQASFPMSTALVPVKHDLKRKQVIAFARLTDNAGKVQAVYDEKFELSRTIFKTLAPGSIKAWYQKTQLDYKYVWDPALAQEIEAAYEAVPRPVSDDTALFKFMCEHCDFSIEHADGSFMDHLYFCQEYTALHYPKASCSPRVMLLHSIMGVGTNCFPMGLDKVPTLQKLVSPEDFAQIEAFPSILRLLVHGPLLTELTTSLDDELGALRSIKFYRACAALDPANHPAQLARTCRAPRLDVA